MMSSADRITFPVYAAVDNDGRVMAAVDDLLLMLASLEHEYAAQGRPDDSETIGRLAAGLGLWHGQVLERIATQVADAAVAQAADGDVRCDSEAAE